MGDLAAGDEALDGLGRAAHGRGARAQLLDGCVDDDAAGVDDEGVLEKLADLVDEVRGQDDRAGVLAVVGEEAVVEDLPSHSIQAQVRLVEDRERCARGEPHDDADGGALPAGELLDALLRRKAEFLDEVVGEAGIPVGEEARCAREHVLDAELIGVALGLRDEARVLQHGSVLHGRGAEEPHGAARGELLAGDEAHERRLAGAVAAEEARDGVLGRSERRVVDGGERAVALGEAAGLHCGGLRGGGHGVVSFRIMSASSSALMPSARASARRGRRKSSRNVVRRSAMRVERAPSATNMPMPRRL